MAKSGFGIDEIYKNPFVPPCGRCREFISQLNDDNVNAQVMVKEGVVVT